MIEELTNARKNVRLTEMHMEHCRQDLYWRLRYDEPLVKNSRKNFQKSVADVSLAHQLYAKIEREWMDEIAVRSEVYARLEYENVETYGKCEEALRNLRSNAEKLR